MVNRKKKQDKMISEAEPYEGYWNDSYDYVFSSIEDFFKQDSNKRMLELGCGRGAFIERYANHFEDVVAVERDPESLDSAMENAYWNNIENIEFFRQPSSGEKFEAESFDVVLLGQSLQYMHPDELDDTFEKALQLLKTGGRMVAMVPHRKPGQSEFMKTYMNSDEEYVTESIDAEAFKKITSHDPQILATKRFNVEDFEKLKGLKILEYKVFQDVILPDFIDKLFSRDRLINLPVLKKYFGTKIMVVLEKEEQEG